MKAIDEFFTNSKKLWPSNLIKDGVISGRLIVLGIVGVALLLAGSFFDVSTPQRTKVETQAESVKATPNTGRSYEEVLEGKLANLLSQVKGAGAVSVNITLENSSSHEYAKNTTRESRTIQEKDNGGGVRTTVETKESDQILLSKESGADKPVMVREMKPSIKGVLVIAEGASDSNVKASLVRAVESGLGVPSYKITVLPQRK